MVHNVDKAPELATIRRGTPEVTQVAHAAIHCQEVLPKSESVVLSDQGALVVPHSYGGDREAVFAVKPWFGLKQDLLALIQTPVVLLGHVGTFLVAHDAEEGQIWIVL